MIPRRLRWVGTGRPGRKLCVCRKLHWIDLAEHASPTACSTWLLEQLRVDGHACVNNHLCFLSLAVRWQGKFNRAVPAGQIGNAVKSFPKADRFEMGRFASRDASDFCSRPTMSTNKASRSNGSSDDTVMLLFSQPVPLHLRHRHRSRATCLCVVPRWAG